MDGREGGYIKLFRRLKSWPLWRSLSGEQRSVVIELLLQAYWKPGEFWLGTQWIAVARGQTPISEDRLALEAGVSRKVVRTVIAKLIADEFLTRLGMGLRGQRPYLLTILNYDRYQGGDEEVGPTKVQSGANDGPMTGQRRAPIEEGKEEKKEKKTPSRPTAGGRHATLTALLVSAYESVRQDKYPHAGAKDAVAVKRLMGWSEDDAEIVSRFKAALESSEKFWRAESICHFATSERWARFAPGNVQPTGYSAVGGVGDFTRKEANEF